MNHLNQFLQTNIPFCEQRFKELEHQLTKSALRRECMTLMYSRARKAGATSEIKEIFNLETDLYCAYKIAPAKEFIEEVCGINNGFFFSINCINDNSLRGLKGINDVRRVFIDCGGIIFEKSIAKLIARTIDILSKSIHKEAVYIIT